MLKISQFIMLTFAITIGVTAGNLLSSYITASYTAYQLSQVNKKLEADLQAKKELQRKQKAINEETKRSNRMKSSIASKLKRQCSDWKEMNAKRDGHTSRVNMSKYCGAYLKFINTGVYDRKLVGF